MAILDLVHSSSAQRAPFLSSHAQTHQPSPEAVGWMLRITTIVLLLVATLFGIQLAMSAPTVSPVTVISQEPGTDRSG
jgi:hypothetical protein